MSALPTRIESQAGRSLTAGEIFEITRAREKSFSQLLIRKLCVDTETVRFEVARNAVVPAIGPVNSRDRSADGRV